MSDEIRLQDHHRDEELDVEVSLVLRLVLKLLALLSLLATTHVLYQHVALIVLVVEGCVILLICLLLLTYLQRVRERLALRGLIGVMQTNARKLNTAEITKKINKTDLRVWVIGYLSSEDRSIRFWV
jgi:ABC-type iron transport system FetAB permease component